MVFIIKPLSAQLAEDHDLVGSSDPYCVIQIGGQKFQTKAHNGGGKQPKWNETFTFNGNSFQLKIKVYDEDTGKDDFIGEGVLSLNNWMMNPNKAVSDYVQIFEKHHKKIGQVLIGIEYQGPAVNPGKIGW